MRLRFDQLGKQVGCATLEGSGTATTDAEITPDAQRADLRYEPDPARSAERMKPGLLGRLAATPCLIELFSKAPSAEALRACLHKHLAFWHAREREARKKMVPLVAPMLWILAAGRPVSALRALAFVHARGFPAGVYRAPAGFRVGLVAASELPRTRSTLLVRLMAAGPGLRAAIEELRALPPEAPERALATRPVLRLAGALTGKRRPTREEQEFIMATQDIIEELMEKGRREALREVEKRVKNGRLEEARAALRSVLAKRGLVTSAEEEAKIDACTKTTTLRRWLDQAIDAKSGAEALR